MTGAQVDRFKRSQDLDRCWLRSRQHQLDICRAGTVATANPVTCRARTPARKAGFSPWAGKIARDADSPLEEDGFELVVPAFTKRFLYTASEP
jgi:hypothetical protein